jgi:tetratricopeptide (TPR) repeat protein
MGWKQCIAAVSLCAAVGMLCAEESSADKAKKAFNIDQPPVGSKTPVFDKGESDDFKYKTPDERKFKEKKNSDTRTLRAIKYHVKNLKDPDPEVRQSSCEMLGVLGAFTAVPDLIGVLDPDRNEKLAVMLTANGALVRVTGKNFGYKGYDAWMHWWTAEGATFVKEAETGPDEKAKLRAESSNTIGRELMNRGDYSSAEAQFLDAVNSDPTKPDYRNNLGLACMEQGRHLDAMEYFQEITGTHPDLPQPYMNIGQCYARMGKTIEAQSFYKKAMELDKPGNLWEPLWQMGREYMKRGDFNLAFEYLDQSREKATKRRIAPAAMASISKDLALTHYGMDQYHSAWKEIKNVETLGFACAPDFVAKVREALTRLGVDPDEEDRRARAVLRGEDPDDKNAGKTN